MLTATRQLPPCSPLELAAALRRLHGSGIRRGYVLVAPTRLMRAQVAGAPRIGAAGGPGEPGNGHPDSVWADTRTWSRLCNRIHAETGLGVVLVEAAHGGLDPERVLDGIGPVTRSAVLADLSSGERSALVEISRGVCTGDRGLLMEARLRGVAEWTPRRDDGDHRPRAMHSISTFAPSASPLPAIAERAGGSIPSKYVT